MTTTQAKWLRVTRAVPCRICGKPDWCTVSSEGAACCMRVESSKPMANGGWLHIDATVAGPRILPPSRDPSPTIDAASLIGRWRRETCEAQFEALAETLGLPVHPLAVLGASWAREHRAWAFPMHDGQGAIVGIRLRNDAGEKWAVRGSRSGIFAPNMTPQDTAMVCEGPTDTAAAIAMGFWAVGRPSCSQGYVDVVTTFLRLGVRRAVIVADNDGPGLRGVHDLAKIINMPHKIFIPPTKDLRQLWQIGEGRRFVEAQLSSIMWRTI